MIVAVAVGGCGRSEVDDRLSKAAKAGDRKEVEALIARGVDVNA